MAADSARNMVALDFVYATSAVVGKARTWQGLDIPRDFPTLGRASRSGCSDFLFPLQNLLDELGYNDNSLNDVKFTDKHLLDACYSILWHLRNRPDLTEQDILLMNAIGNCANQSQQRVNSCSFTAPAQL